MKPFAVFRPMTPERLDVFGAAWVRGDTAELRRYLTEDVVYSPLSGYVVLGVDAVTRRFAEILADDAAHQVIFAPATVSGSLGTCRWLLRGNTPEGAAFEIEGVDLYQFEGDKIRLKDVYQKSPQPLHRTPSR